jgi:GTPase SAR1 family protein
MCVATPAGVGKTCILLRFAEGGFNVSFMSTVGYAPFSGRRVVPSSAQRVP